MSSDAMEAARQARWSRYQRKGAPPPPVVQTQHQHPAAPPQVDEERKENAADQTSLASAVASVPAKTPALAASLTSHLEFAATAPVELTTAAPEKRQKINEQQQIPVPQAAVQHVPPYLLSNRVLRQSIGQCAR